MGQKSIEARLGIDFTNKALLTQALTHRSAHHKNNERLEFLGDSLLNCIMAEALFQHFPKAKEGELSRARAHLVNQTALAEIAQGFALGDYLILGQGELKSGGFRRASILSDALEAIMGAYYLDKGFEALKKVLLTWYRDKLAAVDLNTPIKDPKTLLQEALQAKRDPLPYYEVIEVKGEPHEQSFTVKCTVNSEITEANGPSRRIAEQKAAQLMLDKLHHE